MSLLLACSNPYNRSVQSMEGKCLTLPPHCSYLFYLLKIPYTILAPCLLLWIPSIIRYTCHSVAHPTILLLWEGVGVEHPSADLIYLEPIWIHYLDNINHLDLRYTILSYSWGDVGTTNMLSKLMLFTLHILS